MGAVMCQINLPQAPQQGWQCPVCRTVNAPWAAMCMGCPKPCVPYSAPNTSPVVVPVTPWQPNTNIYPLTGGPITTASTLAVPNDQYQLFNDLPVDKPS